MAKRDLPYEVPELGYVGVESRSLARMRAICDDWWGDQTPLANCVRCGRYTEDPNRDAVGDHMHQDPSKQRKSSLRSGAGGADTLSSRGVWGSS